MHIGKAALISFAATLSLAIGCTESEIKTYRVAKEAQSSVPTPAVAPASAHGEAGVHVHGTVPAGWEEQPAERMRAASFLIHGPDGKLAQMAIIPIPGAQDIELKSVNMWRENELGLEPWNDEQYNTQAKMINVGGNQAHFFDFAATSPRSGEDFNRGILGAVFQRNGVIWFAKMSGDAALVESQKQNFQSYLESLEFHEDSSMASTDMQAPVPPSSEQPVSANSGSIPSDSGLPRWNPPANWQPKTPGPMLTAAYAVDAGAAEVTISRLGGEGGGMIANVNRWRGQLGLAPMGDAELEKSIKMIDVDGKNAYLADLQGTFVRTGKPVRMLAVGVPRGDATWFYKLMGDEAIVEKEKDPFLKFIKSAY